MEAIEELFVERKRISGPRPPGEAARSALDAIYENDGANAHDLLAQGRAALRGVAESDPGLGRPRRVHRRGGHRRVARRPESRSPLSWKRWT